MIVPMHKYSFLLYHAGYSDFLRDIKKMGVVHIETKIKEPTEEMQDLYRQIKEVEQSVKKLDWYTPDTSPEGVRFPNGEAVFHRLKEIEKEQDFLQHHRARLEKEESQLMPWGDFNWQSIKRLETKGLKFRFFTCSAKKFQTQWQIDHYISLVNDESGIFYFLKIDRNDADISEFLEEPGVEQVYLPQSSLSEVQKELAELQKKSKKLHTELEQIAGNGKTQLIEYGNSIRDKVSEQNALLQTTDHVEGKVRMIEGFVPETKKADLDQYLEEKGILYISKVPDQEEKVPVLLKNNKFAKLYEVIANLYDLPNHTELDLVPFFAPFYMMFFGFCMGDGGYGLLILLGCTLAKRRIMGKMKDILTLAQWLGLATVIFGSLTGTFFGIPLINSDLPVLQGVKKYMLDTNKLFNLSLILGGIQILFGMVVRIFNVKKSQGIRYAFSTIGWLILLIGSGILFGVKKTGWISKPSAEIIQYIILGVAGGLIFILNHPKRNVLVNIGAGLWDTYGMISGIFGDLLSYIRLFALGISSGILGFVFNQLAMSLKPDNIILGPLVMFIILIIGHGITIFMAALGAFVHPMRLTFVEFYKNAGFTGGGKPYAPFEQHTSKA